MPVHTVKHTRQRQDKARGSARDRGYSTAWDKFSKAWRTSHPLCGYCINRTGRTTAATQVDHIIPHKGDPDLFWPDGEPEQHFMATCDECHNVHKQRAEQEADRTGQDLRIILRRMGML